MSSSCWPRSGPAGHGGARASVRLRDGTEKWVESTVKPWVVGGEIVGSVSVSRDVSETVEAELVRSQQERFVAGVLDVAGSLVIVLDPTGTVVQFNAACEQLTGYDSEEMVGHAIWDRLIPSDDLPGVQATFADLRAGLFPNTYENHWLRRDGSRRLISWSSTCLTDNSGVVTHVIGTGTDITQQRRTENALAGIARVGQVLASHGPTAESLNSVLETLAHQMGYDHLSLLIVEGDRLRVGAARGFANMPSSIGIDQGIVGRVARTGVAAWVPDVRTDADYVEACDDVRSEIAVPLIADGRAIGVLDIETTESAPFADHDLRLALAVAERVASALLLGREQLALAQRAQLLAALSEFARATNAILEPERLAPALMEALLRIFPGDVMTLTTRDRETGRYRLTAAHGVAEAFIGADVPLGDGPAGRAIAERVFLGPMILHRPDYASALRDEIPPDALISVAVPLIQDETVLGAISVGRADLDHPFTDVECEVMQALGAQVALAMANALLHQEVSELAIHDGLTGLYNRRHFDATLDLIFARWRRNRGATGLSAIMFDLDHFGRFNRDHGHQAGDAVLRAFAGLLHERLRSSDLVARYGGEEFVVILEECELDGAVAIAEDIRSPLDSRVIEGPVGEQLNAHVSAGCAAIDPGAPTKEALLRAADEALFRAKRGGRNRVASA